MTDQCTKMRLSMLLGLLAFVSPLFAEPSGSAALVKRDSEKADDVAETPKTTLFNDKEVPPMIEISGETLADDIQTGYWYIICIFWKELF